MNDTGMTLVRVILLVPACSAALLAVLPDDRMTARLNVLGTLLTFVASTGLFFTSSLISGILTFISPS